jgi:hypothetical protein
METVTPPPAAPKPSIFYINSADMFGVSYFCEGNQDYAKVAFHINGVLRDVDFHVSVAPDGKSVHFVRAVHAVCFSKEVLKSIMGRDYSETSSRVVTYDDVAQKMQAKKVLPENKLYWGGPQVVRLKWECTGTPRIFKGNYPVD